MVLNANGQLTNRLLIDGPIWQLCRHFLQIGQDGRQPGGAQVPEISAIDQMLHGTLHVGAPLQQLQGVIDVAGR